MTEQQAVMRRTRFVCISDTHNASPNGAFKLPKGDVLIHAGDMTNQGSLSELKKTVKWLEEADFEAKIVIAGNHDITLDSDFYSQYGRYFHNQNMQDPAECQRLFEDSPSIIYLKHEAAIINLTSPDGPGTTFKIFGSPYSPTKGMWGFGYKPGEAAQIWDRIPLDSDIVVTHTPPKYHCDETKQRTAAGCEVLRQVLWRVRPKVAICGHIHEGRGVERVHWDLEASNIKYKEDHVEQWEDPGKDNNKQSLVDLTEKGRNPIINDGSIGESFGCSPIAGLTTVPGPVAAEGSISPPMKFSSPKRLSTKLGISHITTSLLAIPSKSTLQATRGQGGVPPSNRCDLEALSGRMGRRETCVVNAAIMASSWPHKAGGGKVYRKPIVVDIDLPVINDRQATLSFNDTLST